MKFGELSKGAEINVDTKPLSFYFWARIQIYSNVNRCHFAQVHYTIT